MTVKIPGEAWYTGDMKGKKKKKKKPVRNPIAVALSVRHGATQTRMRDRRIRRPLEARHIDEQ